MSTCSLVAFTEASDGDMRLDSANRSRFSSDLGVPEAWATVEQVHGRVIREVSQAGVAGQADGLFTRERGLPLAVFTADCAGVAIAGEGGVGVAHAGWRGADSMVVTELLDAFAQAGITPAHATIGPHIRSCCFEVGPEVVERFPDHISATTWGTTSIDLSGVIKEQLGSVTTADISECTRCGGNSYSHRRDADPRRMATIVELQESE